MSECGYPCSGCKIQGVCPICVEGYLCPPSYPQHGCCLVYPAITFSCAQAVVIYPQMLMAPRGCSGACDQPQHSISLTVPYSALGGEKYISCPYFTQRNYSQLIIS